MIQATVSGRVTKDATVRDAGGTPVCGFSIASNKKGKGGESVATFVNCSLFGKRGAAVSQYITKGTQLVVVGELSQREYQGKMYLELNVNELELMGGGAKSDGAGAGKPAAKTGGGGYDDADYGGGDDQIPF